MKEEKEGKEVKESKNQKSPEILEVPGGERKRGQEEKWREQKRRNDVGTKQEASGDFLNKRKRRRRRDSGNSLVFLIVRRQ